MTTSQHIPTCEFYDDRGSLLVGANGTFHYSLRDGSAISRITNGSVVLTHLGRWAACEVEATNYNSRSCSRAARKLIAYFNSQPSLMSWTDRVTEHIAQKYMDAGPNDTRARLKAELFDCSSNGGLAREWCVNDTFREKALRAQSQKE